MGQHKTGPTNWPILLHSIWNASFVILNCLSKVSSKYLTSKQTLRCVQLSVQLSAELCSPDWSRFHTTLRYNISMHIYMCIDTPTKQENVSETALHTVSRKHVVQPRNRSKTLGTGLSLNYGSSPMLLLLLHCHCINWPCGIVKCLLHASFRISSEVVGNPGNFRLLLFTVNTVTYYSLHMTFFYTVGKYIFQCSLIV